MTITEQLKDRLPALHDALLFSLEVLWREAVATLRFRSAGRFVSLSVGQVTFVECPRRLPWGRSDSVNEVGLSVGPEGSGIRFTVEMQSGDCLVIDGATITVEEGRETVAGQ